MLNFDDFLNENKQLDTNLNEKFVEKRMEGALKIEKQASSHGGYARLTATHFKAKLPCYKEAMKALERGESLSFFEKKYKQVLSHLHNINNQNRFQELAGELETWGEIVCQLKSSRSY